MTDGPGKPRIAIAIAVTVGLGGALFLAAGALAALPALLAFLPLFAGRYLGADRLEALIERRRGGARRPAAPARPHFPPTAFRARGGRLIAFALAERGPPRVVAVT